MHKGGRKCQFTKTEIPVHGEHSFITLTGPEKNKKNKRGFRTKKEAQQYEAEYIRVAKADMDMKLSLFVDIYLQDKEGELKKRTLRNKRCL